MANTDWDAIGRDYRTGRFTNVELARRHGVSEASIRRRAKQHGWQKDLSDEVRAATRARVTVAMDGEALTDEQIIERASSENAGIIQSHRTRLNRWQTLADQYVELIAQQMQAGSLTVMNRGEPIEIDIPADYVGKCLSFGSGALERLVRLERQSHGLDEDGGEVGRPLSSLIDELRAGNE